MYSMTGFGKGEAVSSGRALTVEMKSVNNRFLDLNIKLPKALMFSEDEIRKIIQKKLSRGRVDVYLTYTDMSEGSKLVEVDLNIAKQFALAAKKISDELNLTNDYCVSHVMKMQEVLSVRGGESDEDEVRQLVLGATNLAAENLNEMRAVEGVELKKEILLRIANVEKYATELKDYAPSIIGEYREKLRQRIVESLDKVEIDESRLINEVAFFADKSNIDEEITRLFSHIAQLSGMIESEEPLGRKMDFIIQELNREANTVCSKANDSKITQVGVELKCEIEKLREQIQNVE